MDDRWKGEHLIRSSVTKKQQFSETRRIVNKIYHENRRALGVPTDAARSHNTFVTLAVYDKRGDKK